MIDRNEYMAIRGEQDFLYRYFIKCGGENIGHQAFYVHLNRWLARDKGQNVRIGQAKIVNFLDIKFGL